MSYISAFSQRDEVGVWERINGERVFTRFNSPWDFYAEDPQGDHTSLFGDKVTRHEFDTRDEFNTALHQAQRRGKTFESDLRPEYKVLAREFYKTKTPDLHTTFLDIEVDYNRDIGFSSIDNPYAPINAVALEHAWNKKKIVIAVPPKTWGRPSEWEGRLDQSLRELSDIRLVINEQELLIELLKEIEDSDALCGWNSEFFDIPYIGKRLEKMGKAYFRKLSFDGGHPPRWREVEVFGKAQQTLDLCGRLSIDYLQLFKKFEMSMRMSYKLEAISNEVLPDLPKLHYEGTLASLYTDDFNHFLRYNIRDTECLTGFEEKLGYIALANVMYHESTGLFKDVMGTIRLAELSLVNYCHNTLNVIAPDVPITDDNAGQAQGAFVLKPKAGLQEWVGSIDINSLYPSASRSINIRPETLVGQFTSDIEAFETLVNGPGDKSLSMIFEDTGESIVYTADQWKEILIENKWAVSGFGTVFNQEKQGIIPAILEMWYATRNEYKKQMEDLKDAKGDPDLISYYDRMQYCYKIKLNSLYGALLNRYFRFYDPRMGGSTTGTGRAILKYMCARTNEFLTGEFDPDGQAIVYGDTDSVYFSTFATNKEDAIFIADSVADLVNGTFPQFMRDTFHCTTGFDHIIVAGRECVASRGIFVTPKRYVLKLKNLDGYDCDKLKVMGLDFKKTILPIDIQNALSDFIERYLDGEDWDVIARDVVALKDELEFDSPIERLGLPKGANRVEHYKEQLKLFGDGARLPGHVRAGLYYNDLLEQYGDKDSLKVVSASKLNVFYLKKPIGKTKAIGVPVDQGKVPQWFLDNIEVDKAAQIHRLIDKPLENVLKAVGKIPPSRQTLFVDSVLEF
jgi:DNA polymerase elongation subunit (family B)